MTGLALPVASTTRQVAGVAASVGYVGAIYGANLLITHVGKVPVGFGLMAPAGVYAIGPALVMRDLVQYGLGKRWAIVAMLVGAALSYTAAEPAVATASFLAFTIGELADFGLFTTVSKPREEGHPPRWAWAVFWGGAVGLVLDSVVFLSVAHLSVPDISLDFLPGQMLGKAYAVVFATVVIAVRRRWP